LVPHCPVHRAAGPQSGRDCVDNQARAVPKRRDEGRPAGEVGRALEVAPRGISPPRMKTSFPKDKIKVVLVENIHPSGAAVLRDEGFAVETLSGAPDEAKLLKLVPDAHVLG